MSALPMTSLVFLLLCAAIYLLFGFDADVLRRRRAKRERKEKIHSFKPKGKLSKLIHKIVEKQRSLRSWSTMPPAIYWSFTALCAVGGYFAGKAIYGSPLIAFALGTIGTAGPLLYLSFRQNNIRASEAERLCSAMTVISHSYLTTEDIIRSVRENLENLEVKAPFRDFLSYATYMDSDVVEALRRMERQVKNPYFSQWIDVLCMAQQDRTLKYACVAVTESMHDIISIQQEAQVAMSAVWRDYLMTLIMIFSVPVIFKVMMPDAYKVMTSSLIGQGLFVLLLGAVIFSVVKALKINKPVI
ncbi:MAG: hypothetical protein II881_08790 [Oscillospiraceae bacterium]|nr:hypothetical protein [Oscillospiraceae bacterium]